MMSGDGGGEGHLDPQVWGKRVRPQSLGKCQLATDKRSTGSLWAQAGGGQGMTLSTSVRLYDFCATFGSGQIPEKPLLAKQLTNWSRHRVLG